MPRASSAVSAAKVVAPQARGDNARPKALKARKVAEKSYLDARKGLDTSNIAPCELINPDRPLTEKQLTFVQLWAQGHTILMASVKAGYNDGGSMAYRMCRMPHILKRYQLEKVQYEEAAQMTRKRVMDMLMESYNTAKMVAEPSSMVAAAREIGKMCGYYEPVTIRHQHNVQGEIVHKRMERMEDAELLEFIASQQRLIEESPAGGTTREILNDVEDAHVVGESRL